MAKEVKRQDRAVTSPPATAVRRVDFLLQRAMEKGDRRREMERDSGDNQSEIEFSNAENDNVLPR